MIRLSAAPRALYIFHAGPLGFRFAQPQDRQPKKTRRARGAGDGGCVYNVNRDRNESSVGRSAGFEYFQPPVPQTYRSSYSMPFAVRN
jgi:hypothetical protein